MNDALIKALKYALAPLALLGGMLFYYFFQQVPQDNFIEEKTEEIICQYTGMRLDLSPTTKDPDGAE